MLIWTLIGGIRGAVVGIAAAGAAIVLLTAYHTIFVHPSLERAAKAEGQRIERIAWEEVRIRQLRENERRLAEAQAKADKAAQLYLEARSRDGAKIAGLEQALEAEKANEEPKDTSRPTRPAIPRGVSRALNALGR